MARVPTLIAAVAGLIGCSASPPLGGVRVVTNVPDATLYVDDELRGPTSEYEGQYLRLPTGRHRLWLEHADHISEYIDVVVAPNVAMTVTIDMRPRLGSTQERSSSEGSTSDVPPVAP